MAWSENPPTVLVLASGRGERFLAAGGSTHKLSARLVDSTVLAHTLAAVRASGLPWHLEDAGHPGMGDSIAAAVQHTRDAPGWLVLPGDLPLIAPDTLREVAARLQSGDGKVVLPLFQGQRGHPVAFPRSCMEALLALHGDQGAAAIVRSMAARDLVHALTITDIGAVTDIDTPEDLARAEQLLHNRRTQAPPVVEPPAGCHWP